MHKHGPSTSQSSTSSSSPYIESPSPSLDTTVSPVTKMDLVNRDLKIFEDVDTDNDQQNNHQFNTITSIDYLTGDKHCGDSTKHVSKVNKVNKHRKKEKRKKKSKSHSHSHHKNPMLAHLNNLNIESGDSSQCNTPINSTQSNRRNVKQQQNSTIFFFLFLVDKSMFYKNKITVIFVYVFF